MRRRWHTVPVTDPRLARSAGFTLVELVIVIALTGIIAAVIAVFISRPIEGYRDVSERAALVNSAEMALRRIERDIRNALPNSLRVNGNALEMLNTVDGGRYRDAPGSGPAGNATTPDTRLEFNKADTAFNVLGMLNNAPAGAQPLRVAIYNTGQPGANAWTTASPTVMTPAGLTISTDAAAGETRITLDSGFDFPYQSPQQRFYLVDRAVGYQCTGGNLVRHAGYSFDSSLPPANFGNGGSSGLVTEHVSGCSFSYDPGTATRAGLATLRIRLDHGGESITLMHQVHVDNAP